MIRIRRRWGAQYEVVRGRLRELDVEDSARRVDLEEMRRRREILEDAHVTVVQLLEDEVHGGHRRGRGQVQRRGRAASRVGHGRDEREAAYGDAVEEELAERGGIG